MSAGSTTQGTPRPKVSGKLPVVRPPGATGKHTTQGGARKAKPDGEQDGKLRRLFINIARVVALLAAFVGVPLMLSYPIGPRLFWTLTIAVLPLGIVAMGYYSWRRICPLAETAQLGRTLGIGGKRKTGKWLEANYALVQLGILYVFLNLRLLAINGDRMALGIAVGAVFFLALVAGLVYTGKTWCNFFCPVGVVERIYTEPQSLQAQANSQCASCTACKKFCPDIDLEQGYWKDAELRAKALATYAFPGLVFGFYFYYWVAAGTWRYYFGGAWTREPGLWREVMGPGAWFAHGIPRLVAAPVTLLLCALVPMLLLVWLEKTMARRLTRQHGDDAKWRGLARHRTLTLAAFLAFNTFYVFAGAPTLGKWPQLYRLVQFLVIFLSTLFLIKRWRRREDEFVQEKFARGFLKRWEWGDEPPPSDLKDLYLIHTERQKQKADRVRAYKDTVREMLKDGVVAREELYLLGKLRSQLGISEQDHEKVLGELGVEDRSLFDPSKTHSAEKRLQLEGFRKSVERMIIDRAPQGGKLDPAALEELRLEAKLSREEADSVLGELRDSKGPLVARMKQELDEIESLAARYAALGAEDGYSRSVDFMRFLVRAREAERIERVLGLLGSIYGEQPVDAVRELLAATDPALRGQAPAAIMKCGDAAITERLSRAVATRLSQLPQPGPAQPRPDRAAQPADPAVEAARLPPLLALAKDASPFVRACAVFVLGRYEEGPALELVREATSDEAVIVRETAVRSLGVRGKLGRELLEKALGDKDPAVHKAALRASSRTTAEIQMLPAGLMQSHATGGAISGEYPRMPSGEYDKAGPEAPTAQGEAPPPMMATLDPRAPVDSLTTLEKMMLLRNVGLFDDLEPDDLLAITRISQERRFLAGQVLCREGEVGSEVFILISGKVRVWLSRAGQTQVLSEQGAGVCIGEMAVLDRAPRAANVTAIADVRALSIPGDGFRGLILERPELSRNIIGELTQRLRGMIAQQYGQQQPTQPTQPPQQGR